jgi:hypothetical protein
LNIKASLRKDLNIEEIEDRIEAVLNRMLVRGELGSVTDFRLCDRLGD